MKDNQKNINRLFLVAGYNAQNKVDASLVYMLKKLSQFGDIIFVMDSDIPEKELKKLSSYVLYANATRHKEYDFGSYKRAYIYAKKTNILKKYDFLYLVNDSVYGPVYPINKTFETIESYNTDAFGLVCNPHKGSPHIQSWFIGLRPSVFMTKWFDDFMLSITHQPDKGSVTYLYEQGFTRLLEKQHKTWQCEYSVSGRGIYNKIKKLYLAGMPFIKKNAFSRHNGALGMQISYVLRHIDSEAKDMILSSAKQTFGSEYINWLLTRNPIKIAFRNTKYFIKKIFTEGL